MIYSKMEYVIEIKNKKSIELRTDSNLYELIYDPFTGDFGSYGHRIFDEFREMVKKHGWFAENYGEGIICIVIPQW